MKPARSAVWIAISVMLCATVKSPAASPYQRKHCDPLHVILVHGIKQVGGFNGGMEPLLTVLSLAFQNMNATSHTGKYNVARNTDPPDVVASADIMFDDSFDFGSCSKNPSCPPAYCGITTGAQLLDTDINLATYPQSRVIIIGYSMGGLMARDMIAHPSTGLLQRNLLALITLGTPNLGYPWSSRDDGSFYRGCHFEADQMGSDFLQFQISTPPEVNLGLRANYLYPLTQDWSSAPLAPRVPWLAFSGHYCDNPTRVDNSSAGCPGYNTASDGVVCDQSARYLPGVNAAANSADTSGGMTPGNQPYLTAIAEGYAHAGRVVMCGVGGLVVGTSKMLTQPKAGEDPVNAIIATIQKYL
jgi:hypothetical protein